MPLIACSTDAAAPLPEARLAERLGDALRLDGRLPSQQRPEQLDRPGDELARGEATADADQPLVAPDDEQRVQVLLRLVPLRPAAVHGAARERADVDRHDLHTGPLGCAQDLVPSPAPGYLRARDSQEFPAIHASKYAFVGRISKATINRYNQLINRAVG